MRERKRERERAQRRSMHARYARDHSSCASWNDVQGRGPCKLACTLPCTLRCSLSEGCNPLELPPFRTPVYMGPERAATPRRAAFVLKGFNVACIAHQESRIYEVPAVPPMD